MTKTKSDFHSDAMINCLRNGIKVYPVYFLKSKTIGKDKFSGNNWYLQVDNNGQVKTYPKSIGSGKILRTKKKPKKNTFDWNDAIRKVYEHWNKLLIENDLK